jgi:hypothetical protein
MKNSEIIAQRLINQQIADTKFKRPQEIVSWLIAMQAQEFAMAKWAIGLRLPGWNDVDIENEFNQGLILRTHLLRPTWHFVTPADIRWLLQLTSPHINAASAYYHRRHKLDQKIFKRCNDVLAKTLEGGNHLTRAALQSALKRAKIIAADERLGLIMMRAELDGVICSGPRQGKQFTYALLDERAPASKSFSREEALAEITKRFFASRGPATVKDLSYWCGLSMKELKPATASLPSDFKRKIIEGQEYFSIPLDSENKNKSLASFLVPDYDEFLMSYKNRDLLLDLKNFGPEGRKAIAAYDHLVVVEGKIVGSWLRTIKNNKVVIETKAFAALSKTKQQALARAEKKYNAFFKS